jgi:hypothetical protein
VGLCVDVSNSRKACYLSAFAFPPAAYRIIGNVTNLPCCVGVRNSVSQITGRICTEGAGENVWTEGGRGTRGWRKLNNEEVRNLHHSPNNINMIKQRRLTWVGHLVRMGEKLYKKKT